MKIFYYNDKLQTWTSRPEAVKDSSVTRFYFHNDTLSKVDWKTEPTETLQELYHKRAQQLRDKYEYLVLCYSGGIDSTQMLETFYYNGIHIDEILTVGALSQDSVYGSDENRNGDLYHNVFPTLNKLHLPKTKITVADYSKQFDNLDNFSLIRDYGSDFYEDIGSYISPHHIWWRDLKQNIGRDNDKKTGVLFGVEKPQLRWDGAGCYTQFFDTFFTAYGNFQKTDNFERVNFYSDQDTADIMKKQLHIFKRFFYAKGFNNYRMYQEFKKYHDQFANKLMYDLKNPLVFFSNKSPTSILSLRDVFINRDKNSAMYKLFSEGVKKYLTKIPSELDFIKQKKVSYLNSRQYFLE